MGTCDLPGSLDSASESVKDFAYVHGPQCSPPTNQPQNKPLLSSSGGMCCPSIRVEVCKPGQIAGASGRRLFTLRQPEGLGKRQELLFFEGLKVS